jgi:hypothetical protein
MAYLGGEHLAKFAEKGGCCVFGTQAHRRTAHCRLFSQHTGEISGDADKKTSAMSWRSDVVFMA